MEQRTDLETIYNELKEIKKAMITKQEINSLLETISIMANEDTMNQILESEKDIQEGRIKEINSVSDI